MTQADSVHNRSSLVSIPLTEPEQVNRSSELSDTTAGPTSEAGYGVISNWVGDKLVEASDAFHRVLSPLAPPLEATIATEQLHKEGKSSEGPSIGGKVKSA